MADILPAYATIGERAIDAQAHRITRMKPFFRHFSNAAKAPAAMLPWLAWAGSTDLWDAKWPEERKRAAIRRLWPLHARKGTLGGLRLAVEFAGADIHSITRAPQIIYAAPSLTPDAQRRFLSKHPQLRLYHWRRRRPAVGLYHGAFIHTPLTQNTAWDRFGPRAYLWDRGVETALTTRVPRRIAYEGQATENVEIRRPSPIFGGSFAGLRPLYVRPSSAKNRFYHLERNRTFRVETTRLERQTLAPDLAPLTVRADQVAEQGRASGFFAGAAIATKTKLRPSMAGDRLYERRYLFDPTRTPEGAGRTRYLRSQRVSFSPRRCEIRIGMRHLQSRNAMILPGFTRAHLITPDRHIYDFTLRALAQAKPAATQLLLTSTTATPVLAGDALASGHLTVGAWRDI